MKYPQPIISIISRTVIIIPLNPNTNHNRNPSPRFMAPPFFVYFLKKSGVGPSPLKEPRAPHRLTGLRDRTCGAPPRMGDPKGGPCSRTGPPIGATREPPGVPWSIRSLAGGPAPTDPTPGDPTTGDPTGGNSREGGGGGGSIRPLGRRPTSHPLPSTTSLASRSVSGFTGLYFFTIHLMATSHASRWSPPSSTRPRSLPLNHFYIMPFQDLKTRPQPLRGAPSQQGRRG